MKRKTIRYAIVPIAGALDMDYVANALNIIWKAGNYPPAVSPTTSKKPGTVRLRALLKLIPNKFFIAAFILHFVSVFTVVSFAGPKIPDTIKVRFFSNHDLTNQTIWFRWDDYIILIDGKKFSAGTQAKITFGPKLSVKIGGVEQLVQRIALLPNQKNATVVIKFSQSQWRQYPGAILIQKFSDQWRITNKIALEDYVSGVVNAETVQNDEKYLDLMSIVVRSRALAGGPHQERMFCDSTCCMVYQGHSRPEARQAALRTKGLVVAYNEDLCPVYFHSCCGGFTREVETAIPRSKPHPALQGVQDMKPGGNAWCVNADHFQWTRKLDCEVLHQIIINYFKAKKLGGLSFPITVSRPEMNAPLIILGRDEEQKINPEDFRLNLGRTIGWNTLLSDRFRINQSKNQYIFHGKGFGHRVGLCQAGALARIRTGQSIKEVLAAYFRGSQIVPYDQLKKRR